MTLEELQTREALLTERERRLLAMLATLDDAARNAVRVADLSNRLADVMKRVDDILWAALPPERYREAAALLAEVLSPAR